MFYRFRSGFYILPNGKTNVTVTEAELSVCLQAHLVAAFEKSLSNMTCRLQSLTMTAEQKVQELSPEFEILCV